MNRREFGKTALAVAAAASIMPTAAILPDRYWVHRLVGKDDAGNPIYEWGLRNDGQQFAVMFPDTIDTFLDPRCICAMRDGLFVIGCSVHPPMPPLAAIGTTEAL
jgi:hypothetical protein